MNLGLREQVDFLNVALKKFSISSINLKMLIGSQRAGCNKEGLGYRKPNHNYSFQAHRG